MYQHARFVNFATQPAGFRPCLLTIFFLFCSLLFSSHIACAAEKAGDQSNHKHHDHDHHHEHTGERHSHDHELSSSDIAATVAEPASPPWSLFRLLTLYSIAIVGASLLGGWLPSRIRLSHISFQSLLSVVGGMLIGIGLFHLFPHAIYELGQTQINFAVKWMMCGILAMFFLLRTLHVHHHEPPALQSDTHGELLEAESEGQADCNYGHDPYYDHADAESLSWGGIFLGLSIHTLLDGLALGASIQADAHHNPGGWLGLGVLVGIVLHKPLDSLSFTTMMMKARQSRMRQLTANLVYSLLCPLGATLFLLGIWTAGQHTTLIVGASLAFSAGIFLCIALADLLPEMEFHSHHRWQLSFCLMVGMALAWAIRFLEPANLHS